MIRCPVLLCTALALASLNAHAQDTARDETTPFMHASAASALLILTKVIDGATGSTWDFSAAQLNRGSVDIEVGDGTSVGLSIGYASVPASYSRLVPEFGTSTCPSECDINADLWTASLIFHVGDKPGFHQVVEGAFGVSRYSNFRHKTSDEKVGPEGTDSDVTFSIGCGLGYTANRRFQITLVQDVGFSIHNKAGAASSNNALAPQLMTRLGIRAGIGR